MAATSTPMRCDPCGMDMNHHADKLVDPTTPEEAAKLDLALGGLIRELHACPGCGAGKSRPAG